MNNFNNKKVKVTMDNTKNYNGQLKKDLGRWEPDNG